MLCRFRKHKQKDTIINRENSDKIQFTSAAPHVVVTESNNPEPRDSQIIIPEAQTFAGESQPQVHDAPSDITEYENAPTDTHKRESTRSGENNRGSTNSSIVQSGGSILRPESTGGATYSEVQRRSGQSQPRDSVRNSENIRDSTISNGSIARNVRSSEMRTESLGGADLYSEIKRQSSISQSRDSARDDDNKRESVISNGSVIQNGGSGVSRPETLGDGSHYSTVPLRGGHSVRDMVARMSTVSNVSLDAEGEPIYSSPDLTKKLSYRYKSKEVKDRISETPSSVPSSADPKTPELPPRPDNLLASPLSIITDTGATI